MNNKKMRLPDNGFWSRRRFLQAGLAGGAAAALGPGPARPAEIPVSEIADMGIDDMRSALESGRFTVRALVEQCLARIEAVDRNGPALRSVIETNPEALAEAEARDRERKSGGPRGPLHGIPILIKDNIDAAGRMSTTAGSLALAGAPSAGDAFLVRRIKEAGAIDVNT